MVRVGRRKHWTNLYMVQCECPPYLIGIGETLDLDNRIWRLRENCPVGLTLVWHMASTTFGEVMLTAAFANLRVRGTWYQPESRLKDFARVCLASGERMLTPQLARSALVPCADSPDDAAAMVDIYAAGFDSLPKRARASLESANC